jgi:hypothetical protein
MKTLNIKSNEVYILTDSQVLTMKKTNSHLAK